VRSTKPRDGGGHSTGAGPFVIPRLPSDVRSGDVPDGKAGALWIGDSPSRLYGCRPSFPARRRDSVGMGKVPARHAIGTPSASRPETHEPKVSSAPISLKKSVD